MICPLALLRPLGLLGLAGTALLGCATESVPSVSATSCEFKRLSDIPVTMTGRLPVVRAEIDGGEADLVLDTGADRLMLTESAIGHLNVTADRHRTGVSQGMNGRAFSHPASIARLILGSVDLGRRDANVVPFNWPFATTAPDGFLSGSILFIFDLDIDIPHRLVTLYMPRNCPDGGPAWNVPFATLQAEPTVANHAQLAIPATLEGRDIRATIDTGAEVSVVSRGAASSAGIDESALERDGEIATQGFGSREASARVHRFGEFSVAGETFRSPTMAVADLPAGAGDMLLGEDWLHTHRIWLSYASRRVYVARPTIR